MDSNAIVNACLPELQSSFCDFMLSRDHYADMVRGAAEPAALQSADADSTDAQTVHPTEINKPFLSLLKEYCGGEEHDWQAQLASDSISDGERSNFLYQQRHAHLFLQQCKLGFLHKMMAVFWELCRENKQTTASQVTSCNTAMLQNCCVLNLFAEGIGALLFVFHRLSWLWEENLAFRPISVYFSTMMPCLQRRCCNLCQQSCPTASAPHTCRFVMPSF